MDVPWRKFLSRRFLLALGGALAAVGLPVDPEVVASVGAVVASFILGESAVDFARERSRAEVEKIRDPVEREDE